MKRTFELASICVGQQSTIRQVMACIDHNAKGIALVVGHQRRLVATITDGDIRRAILTGLDLDLPVQELLERRPPTPYPTPLTAPVGTPDTQLIQMMDEHTLRQIPLVDEKGCAVDLALLENLVKEYALPIKALVMTGGYGTRLQPLTDELPKPMLPVGDRPLLELILEQLRQAGIRRVNLATHYKGDIIAQHFGDGREFDMEIQYVREEQPLGTAGALGLLAASNEPLLVINGDILTRVDFRSMLDFHREHQADMTVAVRPHDFHIPYGVIETDGVVITGISEKPVIQHFINAGIYLLDPEVCRSVPSGQPYDMPELINRLVAEGRRVVGFPIREYWLDIGQPGDYQRALADVGNEEF